MGISQSSGFSANWPDTVLTVGGKRAKFNVSRSSKGLFAGDRPVVMEGNMKKLFIGVAAFAVLVVVAAVLLIGNIDKIIKGALEGVGAELLGTKVSVAAVEFDLRDGAGQISGFSIANPAGYSSEDAFRMDIIRLELNLSSLDKQPLIINELRIQDPVVRLEAREDGSSNLKTLLDNIEKNSAKADKKAAEQQPESEDIPRGEPVHISFGKLAITGVKVHASIPSQEPEIVVIPDIVMQNVGEEEGLTPAEIGNVIIGEIITKSLEATLKKKMAEEVKKAAEGFLGDLKKKLLPEKSE